VHAGSLEISETVEGAAKNELMISCPNCGELAKEEIEIYSETLRKREMGANE
jgi:uncharacterized Zn finger protein